MQTCQAEAAGLGARGLARLDRRDRDQGRVGQGLFARSSITVELRDGQLTVIGDCQSARPADELAGLYPDEALTSDKAPIDFHVGEPASIVAARVSR
jgi:hypothetical protein